MPASARKKTRRPRSAERTKLRFLNAAEEVFGSHGYEGTTIRVIARTAGVNLGTLQHYWGGKRQLFRDLFETRFEPVKQEHLRRFGLIQQQAREGKPPHAQELLRALIETTFLLGLEENGAVDVAQGRDLKKFHRLYGRALMDPSPVVIAEITRIFKEPVELFLDLLRQACPQLSPAELDWRVNCIVGAQVFSLVYSERVGAFFGPEVNVDAPVAANWIIHCLLNGVGAPPSDGGPHEARIESRADLEKYLEAFNSRRYAEQIRYYAPDVVYKVGTLTLTSPQAIAEFYADFHQYVREHVAIAQFVKEGDTVAAAMDSRFEAFRDYEKHGLSFRVGHPLRFVSLIFYKLRNGKIHRIRMGRYNGAPDEFYT